MTTAAAAKMGLDDFIAATWPDHKQALRELIDHAVDPEPVDAGSLKLPGKEADPAEEADAIIRGAMVDDVCRLRFYQGNFLAYHHGRYESYSPDDLRAEVIRHLNGRYYMLKAEHVSNVVDQLKAQTLLPASYEAPRWLTTADDDEPPAWDAKAVLATRNALVYLPDVWSDRDYMKEATPRFFTTAACDFDFEADPPPPERWLKFLGELWPDDAESVDLLQQWFGYALTPDTRQQKLLCLIGPKRSGKSTIGRILTALVGRQNVASPTLGGLCGDFGLQPLIGKSLAIIADARLSGRTDQAIIAERLLSVSGEDYQTINRKHQAQLTTRLPTRFVIISNELPRLGDASGALAGRFLILKTQRSFFDAEDHGLEEALLEERAGILAWAIAGWRKLRERGRFVEPASNADLRQQLEELGSPIGAFVGEFCDVQHAAEIECSDLFGAWQKWCSNCNREPGTIQTFGRDLRAAVATVRVTQRRDGLGGRGRFYEGITLKQGFGTQWHA